MVRNPWCRAAGFVLLTLATVASSSALAGGRVVAKYDVVSIKVVGDPDLDTTARVGPDGTIAFPYVGRIKAAGRTEDEVAREVEKRLIALKIIADP
jgi:protein involved in polysaccharide export with SLBB domain